MSISVYVVNTKTNEGKWFELPMDSNQLIREMEILVDNDDYEVHNYEAPFDVGPYTCVYELNDLMIQFERITKGLTKDEIRALLEYTGDLKEFIRLLEEKKVKFINFGKQNPKWSDLARFLVYKQKYMDVPENLIDYIDYERLGSKLESDNSWYLSPNGVAVKDVS